MTPRSTCKHSSRQLGISSYISEAAFNVGYFLKIQKLCLFIGIICINFLSIFYLFLLDFMMQGGTNNVSIRSNHFIFFDPFTINESLKHQIDEHDIVFF